jgi:hypothetical protein
MDLCQWIALMPHSTFLEIRRAVEQRIAYEGAKPLNADEKEMFLQKKKLEAVKAYRKRTGKSLQAAIGAARAAGVLD